MRGLKLLTFATISMIVRLPAMKTLLKRVYIAILILSSMLSSAFAHDLSKVSAALGAGTEIEKLDLPVPGEGVRKLDAVQEVKNARSNEKFLAVVYHTTKSAKAAEPTLFVAILKETPAGYSKIFNQPVPGKFLTAPTRKTNEFRVADLNHDGNDEIYCFTSTDSASGASATVILPSSNGFFAANPSLLSGYFRYEFAWTAGEKGKLIAYKTNLDPDAAFTLADDGKSFVKVLP